MHQQRPRKPPEDEDEGTATPAVSGRDRREQLDDDTDDVLDEIDNVLEDEPETFVRSYVQKGGE